MSDEHEALTNIAKTAIIAANDLKFGGDLEDRIVVALINYQAAQLIATELAQLREKVSDLNENFWRSRQ